MPARVFSEEEKVNIRNRLLEVGFPILREHGMIHMSIPKIASAAGIGTGTFYRFFKSKEEYVYQMILYRRKLLFEKELPKEVREGKRKLTKDEVGVLIRLIADREKSVYANLSLGDENRLFEKIEVLSPDVAHEKQVAHEFINMLDNSKKDFDFVVIANLLKVLAITSQAREELHASGYERTIDILVKSILDEMYD